MKYVGFYEFDPKDAYEVFRLNDKLNTEYKENPEEWEKKYGKFLGAYFIGMQPIGFSLFDFDDPEQIINVVRAFWPFKKWQFMPIFNHEEVIEIYMKKKELESI